MSERLRALVRQGWLRAGLGLGVGYGIYAAADRLSGVVVDIAAQHTSQPQDRASPLGMLQLFSAGPYLLNFHVGGTVVVYGYVLGAVLALAFVLLARAAIQAYVRRGLSPCPYCLTLCPIEATVCHACSLEMVPDEGEDGA